MPVKFKESETIYNKTTRKPDGQKHYYMKNAKTKDLLSAFENSNTRGPLKQRLVTNLLHAKYYQATDNASKQRPTYLNRA